jgi:predicted enzyme involved in methoxymalonyl-ACP biosynthesis
VDNFEIGQETSLGQIYSEFQNYIKIHKQLGILLSINSKNDFDNAKNGLQHLEEREIVKSQIIGTSAPEMDKSEHYIEIR